MDDYCENGKVPDTTISYGDNVDQIADIRYGKLGARLPLIVIIHGGFWKPEYDRTHTTAQSTALSSAGWTTLSLEYRRIPGNPNAMLNDVKTALLELPSKINEHNGSIILLGHSAGGHLSLWSVTQGEILNSLSILGVVALAPVANLQLSCELNLCNGATQDFLGSHSEHYPEFDPVQLPTPLANVTIIHGEEDFSVPLSLSQSYVSVFSNTRLLILPNTGHFELIDPRKPAWLTVINELQRLSQQC